MAAPEPNSSTVAAFWLRCVEELPELVTARQPETWAFGDSAAMADELASLVASGTKRATAGLLVEYDAEDEPIPQPGDLSIVVDGNGVPTCLIRTTEVRIGPLESVDDPFAWDEGEGDRTRASWLDEHRGFFDRVAVGSGWELGPNPETVFERFEVLYPCGPAD
ncbi:MAG: ASCH domain-containing protein [Acidimicrobiia bacterium]|nr:ASCH domain-containing protein [Acidimicrobiia bacterium]